MTTQRSLVLVVDSDPGFLDDARLLFAGQRVLTARSLDEAAEIVPGGRVDLTVLGPSHGSEEGISAASGLRLADAGLPIALVANLVTNRMMLAGMKTGLACVVETPLTMRKVDELLGAGRSGSASAPVAAGPVVEVELEAFSGSAAVAAFTPMAAPPVPGTGQTAPQARPEALFAPDPIWEAARPVPREEDRRGEVSARPVVSVEVVAVSAPATAPAPVPPAPPVAPGPAVSAAPTAVAIAAVAPAPTVAPAIPPAPAVAPAPPPTPVGEESLPPPPPFAPPLPGGVDGNPSHRPSPPPSPAGPEAETVVVVHPEGSAPLRAGAPIPADPIHSRSWHPGTRAGRVVAVMAGKGGSGKTVTATNLAMALTFQRGDDRVVIVDADLQFGDVALLLQLDPARTLLDAARRIDELSDTRLEAMLLRHESGLRVLPAPVLPVTQDELPAKLVAAVIDRLRSLHEVVVVDTPPIFDDHLITVLEQADDVLVVVDMDLPSVKNAKIALDALRGAGFPMERLQLVVNRVNAKARLDLVELERSLGLRVAGSIPSDRLVPQSVNEGIPVVALSPRSRVARAFHILAGLVRGPGDPR